MDYPIVLDGIQLYELFFFLGTHFVIETSVLC